MLEVVEERGAVFGELNTECLDAIGVPSHRRISAAQRLHATIAKLFDRVNTQQRIENPGAVVPFAAVPVTERKERLACALEGQDRRKTVLGLKVRIVPPAREDAFRALPTALARHGRLTLTG